MDSCDRYEDEIRPLPVIETSRSPEIPIITLDDMISGDCFKSIVQNRTLDYDKRIELNNLMVQYIKHRKDYIKMEKMAQIASRRSNMVSKKITTLLNEIRESIKNNKVMLSEEECPVCMEKYDLHNEFRSQYCIHTICKDCKSRCDRCPICRENYIKVSSPHSNDSVTNFISFLYTDTIAIRFPFLSQENEPIQSTTSTRIVHDRITGTWTSSRQQT